MDGTKGDTSEARPVLHWAFPLPRTHCGVLLGNGIQGLMVWGETSLNITVGRAGFWDHRHGNPFSSRVNYSQVRKLVEARDEDALLAAFAVEGQIDSELFRPRQIGGGRLEITFPDGWKPAEAHLDTQRGQVRIELARNTDSADRRNCIIRQAIDEELAWIDLPDELTDGIQMRLVTSWDLIPDRLGEMGIGEPRRIDRDERGMRTLAFEQALPEDDGLALACRKQGRRITLATALGPTGKGDGPMEQAIARIDRAAFDAIEARSQKWRDDYWSQVPVIELPDAELQHIVDYGLHKLAGLCPPHGPAATLQGPWLEEYQLPPWSCDYHFNINIQMIYWPCLPAGCADHFEPLWAMIKRWWPILERGGQNFFQRDGAIMLPHAVDDRCQVVGTFWTGTIDHACTAWMAQLAWLHYRYTLDERILKEIAWPLLAGAFEGYWAMLERIDGDDGSSRLSLPLSVSPEYRGRDIHAAGRDASFQLAAAHMTARLIEQAAVRLGKTIDSRWREVSADLPPYTLVRGPRTRERAYTGLHSAIDKPPAHSVAKPPRHGGGLEVQRIGLWEGMDLEDSHRHHSHLAAVYPFCTIDPRDPAHESIVAQSLYHWTRMGMGAWSGWAVPWASMIHARCDNADGAVALLQHWKRHFTNEGHGTLHDSPYMGVTTLGPDLSRGSRDRAREREVMQIEAGMGALAAVMELLVQERADGIHILPDLPATWRNLQFQGIAAPGALRISARVRNGRAAKISVHALKGGSHTIFHHMGDACRIADVQHSGPSVKLDLEPGQTITIEPAS
ncbi:MAG: hypothetical protein JJU36_14845 [Phycisphaeraceae bacterium]|nr:hypothetical protein [Phycisphaeraceae bacterium]